MEIELDKSFRERIFHAVIFEVTANIIIALSLAWLMNVSVLQSGSLSVISALTATAWKVDDFYHAALGAGGRDNGEPGLRSYGENYYAAFVISPDGHNIEAVCHAPKSHLEAKS